MKERVSNGSATLSGKNRGNEDGFTLVELMVVLSIMGVMGALASGISSGTQEVEQTANLLAGRVSDAAREARLAGPMDESVANAENDRSRTRLVIGTDGFGQFVAVDLRMEDDATSSSYWELSRFYVPPEVSIYGVKKSVTGTEGTITALPEEFELLCSVNAGCGPITFYLQDASTGKNKIRVVVLPLSTIPLVFHSW